MGTAILKAPPSGQTKLPFIPVWRFIAPMLKAQRGDFSALGEIILNAGDAFSTHTGFFRVVYLNDPALVEQLLVGNHKDYHKDPGYAALRRIMGNGLLTSEEEFHLRQRRMMQPAFHKKRIDEYAACMVNYARERSATWQDGATMDVMVEMMAVALKIISKTMFGADVADDVEAVNGALNTLLQYSDRYVNTFIGRVFDALPLDSTRRTRKSEKIVNDIIYRFIREHRESGEDRGDLLSMLLMAQDEDGSGRMTDQQVRDECITLFLAGHETTSVAMSWTWYLLAQHPEVAARLYEELERVLEGGRDATASDVSRLEYTRRVFAESMRLYPPAFGFGRQAVRDNMLGPYLVRKGDIVTVSTFAMQRQAKWFSNPDVFDPDRWLPERCASLPKFAYYPFGGGVRKCIGEQFAWMEGMLLLATFAQQWRFELAPDAKIGFDPKVTLRPRYGMKMIAHKR